MIDSTYIPVRLDLFAKTGLLPGFTTSQLQNHCEGQEMFIDAGDSYTPENSRRLEKERYFLVLDSRMKGDAECNLAIE